MKKRCPAASPIGPVTVAGWDVIINVRGVATIVRRDNARIEGVLWSLTPACLTALDHYEGVARGLYHRAQVDVARADETVDAMTYIAAESDIGTPRPGYLEIILNGSAHFGLSAAHQQRLADLAIVRPGRPNPFRR